METQPSANTKAEVASAQSLVLSAQSGSAQSAPAIKPGIRTSQLWLIVGVLALLAATVFAGLLDAKWLAVIAPVSAFLYFYDRQWLYQDLAKHPDDHLDAVLQTVLAQIPEPTAADAAAIIAALKGIPKTNEAKAPVAASLEEAPSPTTDAPPSSAVSGSTDSSVTRVVTAAALAPSAAISGTAIAPLAILSFLLFNLTGCTSGQQLPPLPAGSYAQADAGYSKDTGPTISGSIHIPLDGGAGARARRSPSDGKQVIPPSAARTLFRQDDVAIRPLGASLDRRALRFLIFSAVQMEDIPELWEGPPLVRPVFQQLDLEAFDVLLVRNQESRNAGIEAGERAEAVRARFLIS